MKGDFSRLTFDPRRQFTAVRAQQGAVQIDADSNEQADIVTHRLDRTFRDIIGDAAGPVDPDSFKVTVAGNQIKVSPGRYYVGGRLIENQAPVTLPAQPSLSGGYCVLNHPAAPDFGLPGPPAGEYAVVLDSWVRHVTVLEMPALREPALGGVQTGTRHQSVWQLKLMKIPNGTSCGGVLGTPAWATYASPSPALLEAGTETPAPSPNQCDLSPSGGYQGLENVLYRVEIHNPGATGAGAGTATFKWARDNASFATLATSWDNDRTITVASVPGDLTRGFQIGDTVELIDVETELRERPGTMLVIDDLVGDTMTFTTPHLLGPAADGATAAARKLRVRRWEAGPLSIPKGTAWLALGTDGVRVNFDKNVAYRTGDHWTIAARTATNDIEWPGGAQPPANIPHLLTPLARIKVDGAGQVTLLGDCRTLFPPLSAMISLLYVGGDGQQAEPNEVGNNDALALARPLTVAVMRGKLPVAGAPVRFNAGAGSLNGGGTNVVVLTDADGLASCSWALAPNVGDSPQQVEARMLDDGNAGFGNPVRFGARVLGLIEMKLAGGDTQTQANPPGGSAAIELAEPLRVAVTRANRPLPDALVRFTLIDGGTGKVSKTSGGAGSASVDVKTDGGGIASCFWKLVPGQPAGHVRAQLMKNANKVFGAPDVVFSGNLIQLPAQGGGGCCVTVGPEGDFAKLDDAIEALVGQQVSDICICLTAGNHEISRTIVLPPGNRVSVSIHGCGAGTRLNFHDHSIKATGIGSFEMADLRFHANGEMLRAERVSQVTLRRLTGLVGVFVLDAHECPAVTVEDCDFGPFDPDFAQPGGPRTLTATEKKASAREKEARGSAEAERMAAGAFIEGSIRFEGGLTLSAALVTRDLIRLDDFGEDIRILRNRLAGAVNIGGELPISLSHGDYLEIWKGGLVPTVLHEGGALTIADNFLFELRLTGIPAKLLGADKLPPKSAGTIKVPRLARLERNEFWVPGSVLAARYAFIDGNRFIGGAQGTEQLLVIAPTGDDGDPTVKIVGNAGPRASAITSTGFPDRVANLPLLVKF